MTDKPYNIEHLRCDFGEFERDSMSYNYKISLIRKLYAALESAHEQLNRPTPPAMPEVSDDSEILEDILRSVAELQFRMTDVEARLKTM